MQEICRDFGFLQLIATFDYKIQALFSNVKHFVACFTDLKEILIRLEGHHYLLLLGYCVVTTL